MGAGTGVDPLDVYDPRPQPPEPPALDPVEWAMLLALAVAGGVLMLTLVR